MADTFTMAVLSDQWNCRVLNRIMIDALTMQRWARAKRLNFAIAGAPELKPTLDVMGVLYTQNFAEASICRVYIAEGRNIPDSVADAMPANVDYDVVYMNPQDRSPAGIVTDDKDPYGRFPLRYQGKPIPPTMQPKYYRPKMITEPLFAPFV